MKRFSSSIPFSSPIDAGFAERPRWRYFPRTFDIDIRQLFVFTAGYALSVGLGEHLYGALAVPSPLWLPDSVLLCTLLLTAREAWWPYMLLVWPIRLIAGAVPGTPLWFLLFAIANDSLKALAAAWLLQQFLRRPVRLGTLREFRVFLGICAIVVPFFSAVAAAPARAALGGSLLKAAYQWYLGDALAQVVVTPMLLYWCSRNFGDAIRRLREQLILYGALIAASYYAFVVPHGSNTPFLLYIPVPFLVWAAVRLGPFGSANTLFLVAFVSMIGASQGAGVFSSAPTDQNVLSIQLFLLVLSVSLLSLAILIAEREKSQTAVRESEQRFRLLAEAAPVMIWMSDSSKRCTDFNGHWLDFTGRSLEAEIGDGWAQGVHPEDVAHCMSTYVHAFDRRVPFRMEYRLRRHDGEYRWILDAGVPRFAADGSFSGYVGSAIDVTDQKRARAALSGLSRKLMDAHEQERTWIAKWLHDDIGQRVVGLTMQLSTVSRVLPDETEQVRSDFRDLCNQFGDLARDIRALSHQLHSPQLEHMGLVSAAAAFCEELSEQHQVEIHFSADAVPDDLPKEIALGMFRVLEESLSNAVKHSGAHQLAVSVKGNGAEIQLEVADAGVGFDAGTDVGPFGLGLISMQERLKIVKGDVRFESQPGAGTKVRARVPLGKTSLRSVEFATSSSRRHKASRPT